MKPGVHDPQRRVARRGFTLLEALVAGAIFFVAVVAISLLAVQGANNASRGMRYAQAARVATQEMELYSMRGYAGLQTLTGGVSPWSPIPNPRAILETTGGPVPGRTYLVSVTITDTSGAPPAPIAGQPFPPQLGGGVVVPSYYISVQVVSQNPNSASTVTVNQATYVSPN
jgi:type II secretory pathway pseudopilin PulG